MCSRVCFCGTDTIYSATGNWILCGRKNVAVEKKRKKRKSRSWRFGLAPDMKTKQRLSVTTFQRWLENERKTFFNFLIWCQSIRLPAWIQSADGQKARGWRTLKESSGDASKAGTRGAASSLRGGLARIRTNTTGTRSTAFLSSPSAPRCPPTLAFFIGTLRP